MSGTTPDRGPLRERMDGLIAEAREQGEPLAWFERLYASAEGDPSQIPWVDQEPNPHLVAWLDEFDEQVLEELFEDASDLPSDAEVKAAISALAETETPSTSQVDSAGVDDDQNDNDNDNENEAEALALVVGCGLGQDAALLADNQFDVTAFDLSTSAIAWAQRLHPASDEEGGIDFQVQNLLDLPVAYRHAFDLVVEIYTLQAMPPELVKQGIAAVASCVAPGGTLVVICRGREDDESAPSLPHPLRQADLAGFTEAGLEVLRFDDFMDGESPPIRRFRVIYTRPEAS